MIPYSVLELQNILSAEIFGSKKALISKLYFDSRNIVSTENCAFISLKGSHTEDAYEKGIRIYIGKKFDNYRPNCTYIVVKEPLTSLQNWAKFHRKKYNIPIVGITGSNGKTIVKEWLNHLLNEKFSIIRNPKSYNSQLGLPLSILEINENHNLGIFEAGISLPDEMLKLEKILAPQIGVLTNIGTAHLENFTSKKQLIQEKIKLFINSEIVVIPYDEEIEYELKKTNSNKKVISFGNNIKSDIQLINIVRKEHFTEIEVLYKKKKIFYKIPFLDDSSVKNSLCLIGILSALDLNLNDFKEKFNTLESIEMRLQIKKGINNCTIINDTFNSDISSISIALDVLNQQNKDKILILSEIQQSIKFEQKTYKDISNLVNSYTIKEVYLIGEKISKYKSLFKNLKHSFLTTKESIEFFKENNFTEKAILIKGSRNFELEKISKIVEEQKHDTILEVNLNSIIANVHYFKTKINSKTQIMAMVKAHSYGMGTIEIAEVLQHYHVDYLGVAYADEGALLRKKNIHLPILVMNPEQSSYDTIIENQLEPEIYSVRVFKKFIATLLQKSITETYPIHIKINTGMNRLGFSFEELEEIISLIKQYTNQIKIISVFSHLAVSDDKNQKDFTIYQIDLFEKCYQKITMSIGYKPIKHILNSSGIIHFPQYQYDMVRLGIGMYGSSSDENTQKHLQTVASLKTVISEIIKIKLGDTVGYGRRFTAKKDSLIATLPIGYADGIPRILEKSEAYVVINQQKAKIIGSICMDMMMCDVTEIEAKEGDEVIVFGESPTIQEFANWCQTIPYECFTSVSPRVKRIYYRE